MFDKISSFRYSTPLVLSPKEGYYEADILEGVKKDNYEVILDRRQAIKHGIDIMEKDDILLILGKGHEDYQIIGKEKIHLDDVEEVLNYKSN